MTDPDVPLLADLDAGLLDPAHARDVERAARADPRSAAVLRALAATRADLATVPDPVAPPELVAGWLATLAGNPVRESGPPDPGLDSGGDPAGTGSTSGDEAAGPANGPRRPGPGSAPARPGGRRPRARGASGRRAGTGSHARGRLLVGAATALVVGVLVLRPTGPPDVTRVELAAVARSTIGTTDLGELADPARRDGCLVAAGHPGTQVFGGRQVRWEGRPGVLLVLSTGELGVFRALVVTGGCRVLVDEVVGS